MNNRFLLMYISEISGHRSASRAVENAIRNFNPDAEILNINAFNYTNPVWERIINKAYMGLVKRAPEIWDYLYDNPKILKSTIKMRKMVHRANTEKVRALFDNFRPDVVICTQAYPCGMVADYKKTFNLDVPLVGILTDHAPHSYWIYDNVNIYVVPSEETGQKLNRDGIPANRIKTLGIPIDPKFMNHMDKDRIKQELGLDPEVPAVLIMGGGQGLGPIKKVLCAIDRINQNLQVLVVAGTNKKLYEWIKKRKFKKKILPFGYIDFIDKLMEASSMIVTKPGGVTTAEALAKKLPMLIIHPLPGQESMNTKFLLKEGVALKAKNEDVLADLIEWLLLNPLKLKQLSSASAHYARPDASVRIAEMALSL